MKLNINKLVFIIVCMFFIKGAFAQSQTHQEHVTIVGSFQPTLRDFTKVNIVPEIENTSFEISETSVTIIDTVLSSPIELELITPLNLKTEENRPNFNNFVLAGIGTRISPVFIYKHNSKLTKNTAFGLCIAHHSSWLNKKEYAPSSFMNNKLGLSLDNKFDNYLLNTKVFYKGETLRYYGFIRDDFPLINTDLESITQKYETFGVQSIIKSNTGSATDFYHEIGIDYQFFHDKFQKREHNASLLVKGEKSYKWMKSNAKQSVSLEALGNTWFSSDSLAIVNNKQLSLLPSLNLSGDFYLLKLGFSAVIHSQQNSNIHVYPALEGGLFMLDKRLKFYAGLDGSAQRITFQKLASDNAYINSILPEQWQHTKLNFKGGIKALAMPGLDFNFGVEYRKTDGEAFFITDSTTLIPNKFLAVYDDVKVIGFLAEGNYQLNQRIHFKMVYRYNEYTMKRLTAAFYQPVNQFRFSGEYVYSDKLLFTSSIFYAGERFASTYASGLESIYILNPYVDLNVGGTYKINDSFEVFVQANNLLNWQYERFYHYPVNGVEFYGGITVRF
jgi:hypothetical protein